MHIIYHCYGGAHSSVVAAAIHLGLLPLPDASTAAVQALPYFDLHTSRDLGRLFYYGTDARGHAVFILGRARAAAILERAVRAGFSLAGKKQALLFVDTLPAVNWWMRIGGFLSRRLQWVGLGRPLVTYGTLHALPKLATLVRETLEQL
ncbi:MAG TPA: DUF3189 family protein [Firmicutes bacterium]|nr:DUF3189 family protein [Bacillota bacterium]